LVFVFGVILLGEAFTIGKVVGLLFIGIGIFVTARF
jgi:uncharacterized membrane protein